MSSSFSFSSSSSFGDVSEELSSSEFNTTALSSYFSFLSFCVSSSLSNSFSLTSSSFSIADNSASLLTLSAFSSVATRPAVKSKPSEELALLTSSIIFLASSSGSSSSSVFSSFFSSSAAAPASSTFSSFSPSSTSTGGGYKTLSFGLPIFLVGTFVSAGSVYFFGGAFDSGFGGAER